MDIHDNFTDNDDVDRLKKLLEDMIQDLNNTEQQQQALRNDFKRNYFVDYHENTREFGDKMFLRLNSN